MLLTCLREGAGGSRPVRYPPGKKHGDTALGTLEAAPQKKAVGGAAAGLIVINQALLTGCQKGGSRYLTPLTSLRKLRRSCKQQTFFVAADCGAVFVFTVVGIHKKR